MNHTWGVVVMGGRGDGAMASVGEGRYACPMVSIPLLWAALVSGPGTPPAPPPGLACLARYYAVVPVWKGDAWWARLRGGGEVPFDDGRAKSPAERIEQPDLEDMFAMPYRPGPIAIPDGEGDDPGRARVEALFASAYPAGRGAVRPLEFLGRRIQVHDGARAAFAKVSDRLRAALAGRPDLRAQILPLGGSYVRRTIAGTNRASAHSFGIALDINPRRAAYWRWGEAAGGKAVPPRAVPDQEIVDAFEAEGFIWGGRWYHVDTMHFEYRPELLDPACAGR